MGSYTLDMLDAERIAVVDDGTPYGSGLADSVARIIAGLGKTVTVRRSRDDRTSSFDQLAVELAQSRTGVLVTTLSDSQVAALMPEPDTRRAGRSERQAAATPTNIVDAGTMLVGPGASPGASRRRGLEPDGAAQYALDAVHLVADARACTGSVDRGRLLKRVREFDGNAPVSNAMRFRDDGDQRFGAIAVYRQVGDRWSERQRSDHWAQRGRR